MKNNVPVVCVSVDENAVLHTQHLYNSLVQHSGEVEFVLLCSSDVTENQIRNLPEAYIVIRDVDVPEVDISRLGCRNQIRSKAMYFRWLIPELIPGNRAIYLDNDIVVTTDINELWTTPISEDYLAGLYDPFNNSITETWKQMATDTRFPEDLDSSIRGLHSGQLLINSEIWRRECVKDQLIEWYRRNPMNDQLALSIVAHNRVHEIELEWAVPANYIDENGFCSRNNHTYAEPKLYHWHGKKPWEGDAGNMEIYERYR